jgi:hypothetical protein
MLIATITFGAMAWSVPVVRTPIIFQMTALYAQNI